MISGGLTANDILTVTNLARNEHEKDLSVVIAIACEGVATMDDINLRFVQIANNAEKTYECVNIEYHPVTSKIRLMEFEEE